MAVASLAGFLVNNKINVKGASPNEEEALRDNVRYATCSTHPDEVVILIRAGNETKVEKQGNNNCHVITVADCQVLEAVESFEVQSILDARTARENKP